MLDAEAVVVGTRPAAAITLLELSLELAGIRTVLDVERSMRMLRDRLDGDVHGGGHTDDEG